MINKLRHRLLRGCQYFHATGCITSTFTILRPAEDLDVALSCARTPGLGNGGAGLFQRIFNVVMDVSCLHSSTARCRVTFLCPLCVDPLPSLISITPNSLAFSRHHSFEVLLMYRLKVRRECRVDCRVLSVTCRISN